MTRLLFTFHLEWQDCMLIVCQRWCLHYLLYRCHPKAEKYLKKSIINILKRSLNQKEKYLLLKTNVFYLTVYIFSICLLQVCNLSFSFCFYEMLKKSWREFFFFLFNGTFLSDDIVMCLCCAQAVYYSSFTMLCIWPVGCVLRELYSQKALYKMSKPPSELWYKCLVQYVLLFNEKKKKRRVEVEEAGSEGEGL